MEDLTPSLKTGESHRMILVLLSISIALSVCLYIDIVVRYLSPTTTVNDEPTVDVSQDIFDTSVSHQGGITTMVFSRTRSSSDPDDISLTECRFIIAARGGTVTYGNPNAISALEELAVTNQEICFPSNCNTGAYYT